MGSSSILAGNFNKVANLSIFHVATIMPAIKRTSRMMLRKTPPGPTSMAKEKANSINGNKTKNVTM